MNKHLQKAFGILLTLSVIAGILPTITTPVKATSNDGNTMISIPLDLIGTCGNQKVSGNGTACQAYAWAYCRIILDKKLHTWNEYWDKDSKQATAPSIAGYNLPRNSADEKTILREVYENINLGRPVVLRARGSNGYLYHYVVAVGYKNSSNPQNLSQSDFIILDPYDGTLKNLTAVPLRTNEYGNYGYFSTNSGGVPIGSENNTSYLYISVGNFDYPSGTIALGKAFSLKGKITSNYLITTVKGEIVNSDGTVVDSASQTVNSNSFSILNSTIDKNLEINHLLNGTYYIRYTAKDSSGASATWDSKSNMFTVGGGTPPSYTVSFDPNGGSVYPSSKTLTVGTALTNMPTPTRTGYTFRGWAMDKIDPDGSGVSVTTIVADGVWTFDKDTTLYAHWEKQATANPPQTPSPGITKPASFDYSGKFGVNNALT